MFSWAKQSIQSGLSVVAGTAEPEYGAGAFHSVATTVAENPSFALTTDDIKWLVLEYTNVETQTFYITADNGYLALLQVIYSNVMGVNITLQFVCKIFRPDGSIVWSTTQLVDHGFSEDRLEIYATDLLVSYEKNEETGAESFVVKSIADKEVAVDLKVTREGPGVKVGNSKSLFGTDKAAPWGFIRHVFWPRSTVSGNIVLSGGAGSEKVDLAGKALFVMACQGMKPHHAAARWNFVTFHGPKHSAVMMEFTTPPSYGSSVANVSAVVTSDTIVYAGARGVSKHTSSKDDPEKNWPEPTAMDFDFTEEEVNGKKVSAKISAVWSKRLDRVDVMAEVPEFVKKIISGAAGTRPFIYQFSEKLPLQLKIDGEEVSEEGTAFSEATFIC